jgi:peptide/nickel transport system substrate-binding protein
MTILRRLGRKARRRSTVALVPLAALAVVVAGCGSSGSSSAGSNPSATNAANTSAGTPVTGGTLKVSFFPDNPAFPCVDPFQVYWIESRTIIRNFADSLTDQDPTTGKIVPWLAKSWTISPDGKTYTFHLQSGVTFSNGDKLDAQAVVDDVTGWIATVKATSGTTFGTSYIQGLTGATVVDPLTVAFHLSAPNSSFLQATSTTNLAITDPSEYQESPTVRCTGKGVIGSGQFVLNHYTAGVETELTKRTTPYKWASAVESNKGDAYLDEVIFNYVAEDSVRTGDLTSGAIDVDWPRNPFSPQDEQLIKNAGDAFEQRSLPGVSYTQFANTASSHPLSDPKIRQALYKAVDLKSYAATVFGPDYPVVQGPFDSTTPYFVSQASKLAYDPTGAEQLLQSDGWVVGKGGYRYKNGKELTLDYPISQFSDGPELLQAQLKTVGINLKLRTLTTAEQSTYLTNGDYDLTADYFTRADPGALQFILNPAVANYKSLATNSATPAVTAHIVALFNEAIRTTDVSTTKAAYAELQNYLIDQGVAFPLFERVQQAGVSSKVHGFTYTSESFLNLNSVWKS